MHQEDFIDDMVQALLLQARCNNLPTIGGLVVGMWAMLLVLYVRERLVPERVIGRTMGPVT